MKTGRDLGQLVQAVMDNHPVAVQLCDLIHAYSVRDTHQQP